jgi:hypothetical protein
MKPLVVVIVDLPMNGKNEGLNTFILFRGSEFELKFSVVGFLCSILPRRSFIAHGYENVA